MKNDVKKLSDVTLEDAKQILSVRYGGFFRTGRWKLTDETEAIKEPCKKLRCERKAYLFWFFDDNIDIELIPDDNAEITFDCTNYDVKLACYIEAVKLGYHVPVLSELLNSNP
jgi:hypothetical protein